tara:strand:- start:856 stop:2010 length:1155 start_codon:yes stop_codon:yes gene_type:complete
MNDYNTDLLSDAKNEYMSRLLTILSPLVIQGVKSIFDEAYNLCIENDERSKYLMTFQNFLSRVIKWNSTIINDETDRIIKTSGCTYLEDLLTCVHITQLKILTSIRVATKQKKIDIDIPKLADFVHKVYILFARKLYTNIYLFEKDIMPLNYQKNMRECEILCREAILESIRDSMPIEQILRAYVEETVDEEIIEEITKVETDEIITPKEVEVKPDLIDEETVVKPPFKVKKEEVKIDIVKHAAEEPIVEHKEEPKKEERVKLNVTENLLENIKKEPEKKLEIRTNVNFNDNDAVINYDIQKSPSSIKKEKIENVSAPKTNERLEKISSERNEQRKLEEEEEEEDDKIKIHSGVEIKLDTLDVHSLDKNLKIETPILTDIEILK